jgi:hypothetical protein
VYHNVDPTGIRVQTKYEHSYEEREGGFSESMGKGKGKGRFAVARCIGPGVTWELGQMDMYQEDRGQILSENNPLHQAE